MTPRPKKWSQGAVVIGCRHNTLEFVQTVLAHGRTIAGIVTIPEEVAEKNQVPTWRDLSAAFPQIPSYVAESYSLSTSADRDFLAHTSADFGLCIGWQRIIPTWFLRTFATGVFGMHACQFPLPRGRGRSPLNWALIAGAEIVNAHVLKYNEKPDAGEILHVAPISITGHDNIHTLQQKCRVIFNRIIEHHWRNLADGSPSLRGSLAGLVDLEYAKRTALDGAIDWSWPARQVHDWVRAQTRPYPGAFTLHHGKPARIWQAVPFGVAPKFPALPGTVTDLFDDGSFVVHAGDALVHVLDHELIADLSIGDVLQ